MDQHVGGLGDQEAELLQVLDHLVRQALQPLEYGFEESLLLDHVGELVVLHLVGEHLGPLGGQLGPVEQLADPLDRLPVLCGVCLQEEPGGLGICLRSKSSGWYRESVLTEVNLCKIHSLVFNRPSETGSVLQTPS